MRKWQVHSTCHKKLSENSVYNIPNSDQNDQERKICHQCGGCNGNGQNPEFIQSVDQQAQQSRSQHGFAQLNTNDIGKEKGV